MTTENNAIPSGNPADDDTLVGALNLVLRKHALDVGGMLPAKVIAFDRASGFAQVQPLISVLDTLGNTTLRAVIASIPVAQAGGGGFMMNFPIKPGDLGYIKVNDRDTSGFNRTFSESPPSTPRLRSYSDAVFYPAVLKDFIIAVDDTDSFVLQNLSGSVKITLSADTITLKAPNIKIEGDMEFTGDLDVIGGLTVGNDLRVNGNIAAVGDITAGGSITPNTPPP